tara:strand:- start:77 stop:280 length:204 start_codon:yes stop_codon:yes gene_type:complete
MANANWIKLHVEMDYDMMMLDGVEKSEAIRIIAKEWYMSQEEVNDIVTVYEKELTDIDKTGDLGDII